MSSNLRFGGLSGKRETMLLEHPLHPKILTHMYIHPQASLVVCWWFVVSIEFHCFLYQLMAMVLKLLPRANLASVESLPVMAVDWLGAGRPVTERTPQSEGWRE